MKNKYSNYKLFWFPEKLEALRTGKVTPPICVRLKPTNRCPQSCQWCVYKPDVSGMHPTADRTTEIPPELLLRIISDLSAFGVKALTFTGGGEPLAHPDIAAVMRHTLLGGMDLSIITNGQLMSGERAEVLTAAKWIRVSMDYLSANSMQRSRGVPNAAFDMVRDNIKWMAKAKSKDCDLTVNFIVTRENYTNLADAAKMLRDWGVELVRFSPLWTPNFLEYHAPIEAIVREQLAEARSLRESNFAVYDSYRIVPEQLHHDFPVCYFCQCVPVIAADRHIYACHNKAYDPSGLLHHSTIEADRPFSKLWMSDELRLRWLALNPAGDCRHQCANHIKNEHLTEYFNANRDNFV